MGLLLLGAFNTVVVLAAQLCVARWLGIKEARLMPPRAAPDAEAVAIGRQILFGGVGLAACYLIAVALFTTALTLGVAEYRPIDQRETVVEVIPGQAAHQAAIRSRDRIVAVAGEAVSSWLPMAHEIQSHPGETIDVIIERDGVRLTVTVDVPLEGRIGVVAATVYRELGLGQAFVQAMSRPIVTTYRLAAGLYTWIAGDVEATLGGPVMIVEESSRVPERRSGDRIHLLGALYSYALPTALIAVFFVRIRREPAHR
jgi:membrane-associated protease RseP (regulator of RpoE activity)